MPPAGRCRCGALYPWRTPSRHWVQRLVITARPGRSASAASRWCRWPTLANELSPTAGSHAREATRAGPRAATPACRPSRRRSAACSRSTIAFCRSDAQARHRAEGAPTHRYRHEIRSVDTTFEATRLRGTSLASPAPKLRPPGGARCRGARSSPLASVMLIKLLLRSSAMEIDAHPRVAQ